MNRSIPVVVAVVLLAGCHRLSGPERRPAWVLTDPEGDDHGDGELLLPGTGEPGPGELDLLALRAFPADDGLELEAEFAQAIRRPDGRVISPTGETLAQVAALGFWAFNLDLYVDLDRAPGSGRTDTLPGRLAVLDPATAWERVICLTPRPLEAKARLASLWADEARRRKAAAKESLGTAENKALERGLAAELEARVFFPRRVAVSGRKIRFAVPTSFLPPAAAAQAAWVAVVTAATPELKVDLASFLGRPSSSGLFLLGIGPGAQVDRLGGGRINDPDQPPIVDVLQDGPQEAALRARPAVLRGVVPTPVTP
jgi:hypothetical protein